MKIIRNHEGPFTHSTIISDYFMGPNRYITFPEEDDNIEIHLGLTVMGDNLNPNTINMYFDFEMPNMWLNPKTRKIVEHREKVFDKLFSINPQIVENRNKQLGEEKWIYSWFPVNEEDIADDFTKEYDIFGSWLWGPNPLLYDVLKPITEKYKDSYCGVHARDPKNKNTGVDYHTKLRLNAKCRITLSYNCQYIMPRYQQDAEHLKKLGIVNYHLDPIFKKISYSQHKSRNIDAFLGKSIVLIYQDGDDIIEDFWIPEKHFIYYKNYNDLDEKIIYILSHYDEFEDMINESFEFTKKNYTTKAWYDRFIRGKY